MKKMVPNKIDSKMGATTPCRSTRIMEKLQGSPAIRNALASRIKIIEEEKAQSSMHGSGLDKPTTIGPDHPDHNHCGEGGGKFGHGDAGHPVSTSPGLGRGRVRSPTMFS